MIGTLFHPADGFGVAGVAASSVVAGPHDQFVSRGNIRGRRERQWRLGEVQRHPIAVSYECFERHEDTVELNRHAQCFDAEPRDRRRIAPASCPKDIGERS
jgi:hypothetical protein